MPARRITSASILLGLLLALLLASPAAGEVIGIVAPPRLRQGDPLLAWILTDASAGGLEARLVNPAGRVVSISRCFDASAMIGEEAAGGLLAPPLEPLSLARPDRRLFGAMMALPPDLPPGAYRIAAGGFSVGLDLDPRSFSLETIKLDAANAKLRTEPSKRKDDEARRLYEILLKVDDSAVLAEASPFVFPADEGRRSAGFGDVRRYLYPNGSSDRSVHGGVDWAVVAGTAVRACARGRVVMAADREVTGKTVLIEHLPGLYSLYFHLSAIEVEEGAVVERGARIALSGSTGMSTGPHLHWELRAMGNAVDPEYWLKLPLLDKGAVAAIMYGLIEGR